MMKNSPMFLFMVMDSDISEVASPVCLLFFIYFFCDLNLHTIDWAKKTPGKGGSQVV